jgi:maltodextrin utilization protein YvdJ
LHLLRLQSDGKLHAWLLLQWLDVCHNSLRHCSRQRQPIKHWQLLHLLLLLDQSLCIPAAICQASSCRQQAI